jgi:hypothetical protein
VTATASPTETQAEVLRRLAAIPGGRLIREQGGFWTTPNCPRGPYLGGRAPEWSVNVQTVRAMERRGWLARASAGPEWGADRVITEAGLEAVKA